jgi:hypothetical protein
LTLTEDRKYEGKYPDARVLRYGAKPLWLGVTVLESSIKWYENVRWMMKNGEATA